MFKWDKCFGICVNANMAAGADMGNTLLELKPVFPSY